MILKKKSTDISLAAYQDKALYRAHMNHCCHHWSSYSAPQILKVVFYMVTWHSGNFNNDCPVGIYESICESFTEITKAQQTKPKVVHSIDYRAINDKLAR